MQRTTANGIFIGAGIAAVVAFFLPFLDLGGMVTASGWEILLAEHVSWTYRLVMLALPIGGLALIGAGATGSKSARVVGFSFGAGVFGYLGYQMVKVFFATTGFGLWLLLAAAGVALFAALAAKKR
ncbi:MAG TPA: hypothetical protein RMH99_01050 [Sandaracinaceae bacterium LLY-WYZ-13_1]|nr:hypothetical protein [Sandaracinaceae bacterium LLY-WYZ-13_1]